MKLFLVLTLSLVVFTACQHAENKQAVSMIDTTLSFFGDTISPEGAVATAELVNRLEGKDSIAIKLEGTIAQVCQNKGCWMELPLTDEQNMRVKFKDYSFFVPRDAEGKKVVIDGWAFNDTVSVEELRHYAEDAGKSKEEIEAIIQPKAVVVFKASGVIIKK
jgi:hypothetical protein